MDTLTDNSYLGANGLTTTMDMVLGTTANLNDMDLDDALDYNEAFPQLSASGHFDLNTNALFSSSPFSSLNGPLLNTTTSLFSSAKFDEDRRRKLAIHEKSATTKIFEIPPDERVADNPRRAGNQSARNAGANNSSSISGQPLQKMCLRIQKETSTNITFFHKDQTLIVTITGRPEQVRAAQVQMLRELQKPVKIAVDIPLDYHRYIIGPKGATLKLLEQETLTRIAVPPQDSQSHSILISGAKDNVKLCEQRILELYHIQLNKGYERLSIPCLYHPWIRHELVDQLHRQLNVTIDLPPPIKQTDEVSIRGEREPVEKAKAAVLQFYRSLEGKIMTFPLDIPREQHRFILGKKGAGLKEIFEKTNVIVRIPNQEDNTTTIQVIGETAKIGDAITLIYKKANELMAAQINAPSWMHSVVKGERGSNLDIIKKSHPDVRIYFRDNQISIEGPPEQVELVRSQVQTVIDDLRNTNTTYLEVEIDPQYYKQMIGKNQIRLIEMQEQTGCDIKFPFDQGRLVKLMGTKESVEKAKQILLERAQKLANERTTTVSIDPQYYPQIIGSKGKKLEEIRAKFHNIQITFPEPNDKTGKVVLHGDKDDVEKCTKFLQQKIKDFYSAEIEIRKRYYPLLIGKGGANIQRLREQMPDVRMDVPAVEDDKEVLTIRLSGKRTDVDKAHKLLDEQIQQINVSLENSVDQHITINPKWHSKFFQSQRKLLLDLQQQFGDVLIKFPERKTKSDQVLLRGEKTSVEQLQKHIENLIDAWENTTTKTINIPHRHHGYLLAQRGAYVQPIEKQYNVQIKFPPRGNNDQESSGDDSVRFTGRTNDIEQAIVALEKLVPIEETVDIPSEAHGQLLGKGGAQLQTLIEKYPDVQILFPPLRSASNLIYLKGLAEQVEGFKKELIERYEKFVVDKEARSFQLRFSIKAGNRSLIINRRRPLNALQQKYDVSIQLANVNNQGATTIDTEKSNDDHETNANPSVASGEIEVTITGYENNAIKCRDEILKLIHDFESTITMEIEIDRRVHARIIGSGGQKLQQIMKEYNVDIKFPSNNQSDKVHVIGKDQEHIDACIDHLLILEEDFLQDVPYKKETSSAPKPRQKSSGIQITQPEALSNNDLNTNKPSKNAKQQKQSAFKVKNAPWAAVEHNGHENQQENILRENKNSQKSVHFAPSKDDLGEYPSFANGISLSNDENSSHVHQTTVNTIPVKWGPPKRNK